MLGWAPAASFGWLSTRGRWESGIGTPRKSSAVQRFRPITEVLSPSWRSRRHVGR